MGIKANVRRRLAIGGAGALLASMVITGIAPVVAETDTRERDYLTSQEIKDLTNDTRVTITSIAVAPAVVSDPVVEPTLGTPIMESRDDRT